MSLDSRFAETLKLKYVHGILLSSHEMVNPEGIASAMKYRPRDGDVILAAYAKTGSSWLLYVIWEILHKGGEYHDMMETMMKHAPNIDVTGSDVIESLPPPRFYKYHLPCDAMNINENAKYIYIHRRPEDVLASYYHFSKFFTDHDYDFDFYFEAFMSGNVWYGDYFDHVLAAYEHRNDKNFLFVSYEELKSNTRAEIFRIAEFLGEEYSNALTTDAGLVEKILHVTSFNYMKNKLSIKIPNEAEKSIKFFRKGTIGDGKAHLSSTQKDRLRQKIKDKMRRTDLMNVWLS